MTDETFFPAINPLRPATLGRILAVGLLLVALGCSSGEPAFSPAVTAQSETKPSDAKPSDAKQVPDAGLSDSGAVIDSVSGQPDTSTLVDTGTLDTSDPTDVADPPDMAGPDVAPDSGPSTSNSAAIIGTWNLHNFSVYADEWRMDDLVDYIDALEFDVLAVQELKVVDGSNGEGPQAFTTLVERLDGRSGLHAPWDVKDSTVGLIYDEETTVIHSSETLFETDWSAFPRAPIIADLSVKKNGGETRMTVVVLHLKAFKDSVDRRREACAKLVAYIEQHPDHEYVVIGDFNDDPHDAPADNSFVDTFLDAEPAYYFVTEVLAPETVTSTGYYHYVNGTKITGEFLDHAVVTGGLHSAFSSVTANVLSKPSNEFSTWKSTYSDHFPVMISFNP